MLLDKKQKPGLSANWPSNNRAQGLKITEEYDTVFAL